MKIIHNS